MAGKTQFQTDAVLNVLRATNITAPGTIYVALLSAMPATDNDTGTELSGNGYSRQSVAFSAPATYSGNKRKVENSGTVTFGPATTTNWAEVIGFKLMDALTAGNALYVDELLGAPKVFTVDAGTDTFTSASHGLTNGKKVRVRNTDGNLPGGLSGSTTYYVIAAATNTFQLSTTQGGSAVNVTSVGDGTNMVREQFFQTLTVGSDTIQFAAGSIVVIED